MFSHRGHLRLPIIFHFHCNIYSIFGGIIWRTWSLYITPNAQNIWKHEGREHWVPFSFCVFTTYWCQQFNDMITEINSWDVFTNNPRYQAHSTYHFASISFLRLSIIPLSEYSCDKSLFWVHNMPVVYPGIWSQTNEGVENVRPVWKNWDVFAISHVQNDITF